jgi:hypothetical protein
MVAVDHEDVAGAVKRSADRVYREAAPVERMGGVGHFDLSRLRQSSVADWGSPLMSR